MTNYLLSGIKSLIIDLRNNGGGLVDEALDIADLICNKGETLLITADKNGNKETRRAKTNPTISVPIVLITNEGSASASEILVGALKDNGKATVVGEKTFGKEVIQELVYLSNGGALKVTFAEYYTPNEDKINKVGIEPDYKVTDREEQLQKAIDILKNMWWFLWLYLSNSEKRYIILQIIYIIVTELLNLCYNSVNYIDIKNKSYKIYIVKEGVHFEDNKWEC